MRAIALRNGTFEETHAISAIVSSTTTGCETSRSEIEHWTGTTEGT